MASGGQEVGKDFQSLIDAMAAVDTAHVQLKDALTALHGTKSTVDPIERACRRIVQGMFAGVAATLADFGLQPPKVRGPLTVEQHAARKAKAEATRKARG